MPPAWAVSVLKATTLMPAERACCATGLTDLLNSGPRMMSAPWAITDRAASPAVAGLSPVSRGSSSTWVPVSNTAICAARCIASPSEALPPDSGSSSPTRSTRHPAGSARPAASVGACAIGVGLGTVWAQAASAAAIAAAPARRTRRFSLDRLRPIDPPATVANIVTDAPSLSTIQRRRAAAALCRRPYRRCIAE